MPNHLIIGLGGTGLAVLRALRRRIGQEWRAESSPIANLQFIYVDACEEDDGPCRIDIENAGNKPNLGQVSDNQSSFPGIISRVRTRGMCRSIGPNDGSARLAANQNQQYGSETTSSHEMVRELAREIQNRATKETTVYVYSSLAGGTGSGIFLDAAFELRRPRIVRYSFLYPPNRSGTQNSHAEQLRRTSWTSTVSQSERTAPSN